MEINKIELKAVFGLVILALLTRLLPHPPNFAPITSIALFAGHHFSNKRFALFIPIACMFITDLYIGFHSLMPIIYFSFVMISLLGIYSKTISLKTVICASSLFFVLSNIGVWYFYYPHNWAGFSSCFILAIPFFINSLMGDLFFTSVLQFSYNKITKASFLLVK
ncbi:MAG: hypothetical protein ACI9TK_000945 [Flavobacteriaceae bacterium]|jgi:hypothetical protein|tara:strand:+ start:4652 stop:5146 length:495 start_codon:yes stop_codon:yes gene_type:complete